MVVNGEKTTRFRPTRGLRQGDPISPYLFIIVADALSRQISKAVEDKRIEGIRMKRTCSKIHHLLFADDSIFFMRATTRNATTFRKILDGYNKASRQSVNLHKSCIQFGPTVREATKGVIKETLGIDAVDNAGNYLGIPTNWGRSKKVALGYIKERIMRKMHG